MLRKFVVVGLAVLACTLQPSVAVSNGQSDFNVAEKLGRAAAYYSVCPYLRATNDFSRAISDALAGHNLSANKSIFESAQRILIAGSSDVTVEAFCARGAAEYGDDGSVAKNWLRFDINGAPVSLDRVIAFTSDTDPLDPVRDDLRVLAGAMVGLGQCPSADATPKLVGYMSERGIELRDLFTGVLAGPFHLEKYLIGRWQWLDVSRRDNICSQLMRDYGPGGRVVAGFVRMK